MVCRSSMSMSPEAKLPLSRRNLNGVTMARCVELIMKLVLCDVCPKI